MNKLLISALLLASTAAQANERDYQKCRKELRIIFDQINDYFGDEQVVINARFEEKRSECERIKNEQSKKTP